LAGDGPGRLFIVGDGKQSIYRFRGAVVELFGSLGRRHERTLALRMNFRTHGRLVQACNHLFKRLFDGDGAAQVPFEALEAYRLAPPQEAPALELILVPSGRDMPTQEDLDAREARRWEAWALATRLRQLVDEGRRVHDPATGDARPLDWGDIAILFRATTDVPLYEEVFKQQRLPFVTVAGRGFYGRQEVRDLLNLLVAVAAGDGSEDLALASVLRSPLFGLSDEALLWLALHRPKGSPLSAALADPPADRLRPDDLEAARRAHEILSHLRGLAGRITILELLRIALRETGFLATLSGLPDGDRRRGNVEKLLEVARERGAILLSDFNRYVQDLTAQETRESEALVAAQGAVQLLTVHAAKGLEFPVVVLADAGRSGGSRLGSLLLARNRGIALKIAGDDGKEADTVFYRLLKREESAREQAEETRLLYVGATRARDLLIVSGRTGRRGSRDWLNRLLDVLECPSTGPNEIDALECEWGQVRVWRLREWPSDLESGAVPASGPGLWPVAAREGGTPFASAAIEVPPLLAGRLATGQPVTGQLHPVDAVTLGLRAGDARAVATYRHRVQGAPGELRPALPEKKRRQPWGWQIGEVAHRALARWQLPSTTPNLAALLEAYAWNLGLTDRDLMIQAVTKATEVLQRFEDSPLYAEIRAGNRRFTEVPFTVEWQGRLISGQVDLLYERSDGYYALVDFKAAYIPRHQSAEEYALEQFGASLALAQRAITGWLGTRPSVTVFFLFQGRVARLSTDRLRECLNRLAQLLVDDDPAH
jgi:ATP-dependent helicase/nuclease subunit A